MDKKQLEKINKFTRRELSADEVYTFSVILCDNEIDRDGERFSDEALGELQKLFIGKTGIFDHDARTSNQSARIFDTEIVEDSSRITKNGDTYKYLRALVYMVRTDENRSLIAEIDGGIKKEVSISCAASKKLCSVCGCDKGKTACAHVRGKMYGGKLCHTVLGGITDAYEWSFVAVPAQVNAGVTKKYSSEDHVTAGADSSVIKAADEELRRDIRRLAFFAGGRNTADSLSAVAEYMCTKELIGLKKSLEKAGGSSGGGVDVQLAANGDLSRETEGFSMK